MSFSFEGSVASNIENNFVWNNSLTRFGADFIPGQENTGCVKIIFNLAKIKSILRDFCKLSANVNRGGVAYIEETMNILECDTRK